MMCEHVKPGTKDRTRLNALAANVARLSNLLTRERVTLPHHYLKDRGLREAYIAYYLPANMYKVFLPLRELSMHSAGILRKDKLRILDLGSGPGTAIHGVMDFFSTTADKPFLEFTAVDPVEENLRDAERLFRSFKEDTRVDASLLTLQSGIERTKSLPEGPFDIIILSNVLSEVFRPDCHNEPGLTQVHENQRDINVPPIGVAVAGTKISSISAIDGVF